MQATLKLIYPLRSATKYALLKNPKWNNLSLEWTKQKPSFYLQTHLEKSPLRLEWVFHAPVSIDEILKVALEFEKELFGMLELQDLMPKEPYLQAFQL